MWDVHPWLCYPIFIPYVISLYDTEIWSFLKFVGLLPGNCRLLTNNSYRFVINSALNVCTNVQIWCKLRSRCYEIYETYNPALCKSLKVCWFYYLFWNSWFASLSFTNASCGKHFIVILHRVSRRISIKCCLPVDSIFVNRQSKRNFPRYINCFAWCRNTHNTHTHQAEIPYR